MTFKKSLVITTALSAAAMLAANAASAASKPKLKISGYQETYFGVSFDRDTSPNGTPTYAKTGDGSFGIFQYGEIRFKASGKTDNGLKWGVRFEDVQDEADGNRASDNKKQSTDEAHLWIKGSWGKLEIGGQDGAADRNRTNSENLYTFDRRFAAVFTDTRTGQLRGAESGGSIRDSSDDTKLTYWSPRVSGVQVSYSYAPHAGARGSVTSANGSMHEAAITYKGKVAGGKLKTGITTSLSDEGASDSDSSFSWRVGAIYSKNGFSVGAGHVENNRWRGGLNQQGWDVGGTYGQGPWEVGVGYFHNETDNAGTDDQYQQYAVFGAYNLGGGLALSGGVIFVDLDDGGDDTADNKDTVAVFKITAKF